MARVSVIEVVPVGLVPPSVLHALPIELETRFPSREVRLAAAIGLPPDALDTARDQYRADALVDLVASVGGAAERRLGVVDADLFVPELNFVFGLARDDVAVISIARLHDPRRLVERAVKEAVHELGHTYGLHHCRDPRCVMRFSNTLAETDRKAADLCAEDRDRLDVVLSLARSA